MLNLGDGFPTSTIYPVDHFEMHLKDKSKISYSDSEILDVTENHYITEAGSIALTSFLREFITKAHQMPYHNPKDWELILTTSTTPGNQNILFQVFDTILNSGDYIFLENPTSSETICILEEMGINLISVKTDHDGLIPEALEAEIHKFIEKGQNLPKVLHLQPVGQNPSGSTLTFARKEKIYSLCSEHNLLILEDDPYWALRFADVFSVASIYNSKSLLHLDLDHRVIRLDSFCNFFSPGIRGGFITGPTQLLENFRLMQAITSPPAGLQKALLYQLLLHYGEKGICDHIIELGLFYAQKKKEFFDLCEKYLAADNLVEWNVPMAGMFSWFKLKGIEDSREICDYLASNKVLLIPGFMFSSNHEPVSPYVRVCFVAATRHEVEVALDKFAKTLREFSNRGKESETKLNNNVKSKIVGNKE
jgi:kynurenine/2-aminoadipate aminotransferase